jgi:inorganic triphosphatase YgiF
MPEEAELKLAVRPEHAARIGRHPVVQKLKTGRASTKHLVGTYYDTPDLLLRRRDMSLRVRKVDRRFVQTLKRMKPSEGAIFERDEWEADVAGDCPDISKLAARDVRRVFEADGVAAKLQPLFKTDVRRTVWHLCDPEAEIELALDIGEIRDGNGGHVPVCEAELELKSGNPRRLYDVALALTDKVDCTVSGVAKSERGYALYRKEPLVPVKAARVPLKRATTVWQGFVAISRNCLAHLEANAPVARDGRDPEGIHQARVAIRRLRAAFKVFKPVLPEDKRQYFAKDLRWLQQQLGDARDLDVFLGEMLDPLLARAPKEAALIAFRERVETARTGAYGRARKALESKRYGRLRLELERWFAEPLPRDADPRLSRGIRWFARRSIRKAQRKMLAAGADLDTLSEAGLHALRIRGKQVRYCVEFFAGLFPEKGPRTHAKLLARLQDCLGALNDSAVAHDILARMERSDGAIDPRARAYVDGWFAARIHDERATLGRIWKRVSKVEAYWASR